MVHFAPTPLVVDAPELIGGSYLTKNFSSYTNYMSYNDACKLSFVAMALAFQKDA